MTTRVTKRNSTFYALPLLAAILVFQFGYKFEWLILLLVAQLELVDSHL